MLILGEKIQFNSIGETRYKLRIKIHRVKSYLVAWIGLNGLTVLAATFTFPFNNLTIPVIMSCMSGFACRPGDAVCRIGGGACSL